MRTIAPRRVFTIAATLLALTFSSAPRADGADAPADPKALLDHPDPERRTEGLRALAALGKDARREALAIRLLADPDWAVAIEATTTLVAIGGEPARDALAATAVDGEIGPLRDAALVAAETLDAAGASDRLLYRASTDADATSKSRALIGAARLARVPMLKTLRPYVSNPSALVEAAAYTALGTAAGEASERETILALLLEALPSRRAERGKFLAYAAVIDALASIGDPRARAALATEVALQPDDDDYLPVRVAALLGRAGEPAAKDAVIAALPSARSPAAEGRMTRLIGRLRLSSLRSVLLASLAHKEAVVRGEAVVALAGMRDTGAIAAIEPLLEDEHPDVRRDAWSALASLDSLPSYRARVERARGDKSEDVRLQVVVELFDRGDPAAIPFLAPSFADSSWHVACAAIAAAGALGVAEDMKHFEPLLEHRDWRLRAAAFEALGRLRAARAIPRLAAGLGDKDPVVRGVCLSNLQILTSQRLGDRPEAWLRWFEKNGSTLRLVKRSREKRLVVEGGGGAPDRYAPAGYGRRRGVEILQKARILVVTGAWDHVERVLDHLRIPNTTLRAQELDDVGLNPNQVVLINCEGNVDSDGAERLRWFATVGGYVIATDWAITKAVARCFPGYVEQLSATSTGNDVVRVEEPPPGHAFTAGVFEGAPSLSWWLEVRAFPVTVVRPRRVEVLVDSREMRWKYGASPLAATFRWGLGKVTHAVSHFALQEEALASASTPRERMIFAADRLGIPLAEIRRLAAAGRFDGRLDESTMRELAPEYSMFRILVNIVGEKSKWVEGL